MRAPFRAEPQESPFCPSLERQRGLGWSGGFPRVWVPLNVALSFCPGEAVEKAPLSSGGASLLMGWKTMLISPKRKAAALVSRAHFAT